MFPQELLMEVEAFGFAALAWIFSTAFIPAFTLLGWSLSWSLTWGGYFASLVFSCVRLMLPRTPLTERGRLACSLILSVASLALSLWIAGAPRTWHRAIIPVALSLVPVVLVLVRAARLARSRHESYFIV